MIEVQYLKSHSSQSNQSIIHEYEYNGMPIMRRYGPFVYNRLRSIDNTIKQALKAYPEVIAIRLKLKFPFPFAGKTELFDPQVFGKFLTSLKTQLKCSPNHTRERGVKETNIIHYFCIRELGLDCHPYYQCILLLDFSKVSKLSVDSLDSDCLIGLIRTSWASALGEVSIHKDGLASFPDNSTTLIKRGEEYDELFYTASYFAKVSTKSFGSISHQFSSSK